MKLQNRWLAVGSMLLLVGPAGVAQGDPEPMDSASDPIETLSAWREFEESLKSGSGYLNLNYRIEHVDADTGKNALASTLRTAVGYRTAPWRGFNALFEVEDVSPIGNALYNGPNLGDPNRPVVADPNSTEINQVYVDYGGFDPFRVRVGRQEVNLDNQRFIGAVPWRQNYQSLDAVTLKGDASGFDWIYGYVANANRIFGDDSPIGDLKSDSHIVNVSKEVEGVGTFTLYDYLLDFDDAPGASRNTYGLQYKGQGTWDETALSWHLEFAQQDDAGDNPGRVDADYIHGVFGAKVSGIQFRVGYERLGGSGSAGDSFQTPLATLHAFNGWADQFLATPDGGLEDLYASIGGQLGDVNLTAIYHDFSADTGGDFGSEIDLLATLPINESLKCGFKYANYMEDGFSRDTEKFWFWLNYSLPVP